MMLIATMAVLVTFGAVPHSAAAGADSSSTTAAATEGRPCAPSAVVVGPPEITARVLGLVGGHGIATTTEQGCQEATVRASLAAVPGRRGYALEIVDTFGRHSRRQVTDARMAASLIESFAMSEDEALASPLAVAAPAVAPPPIPSVQPVASSVGPAAVATVSERPASATDGAEPGLRVMVAGDLLFASDHSHWGGGHMIACGRVGRLCIGGLASLARDGGTSGPAVDSGDGVRTAGEVLLVAAWPSRAGRWSLVPMAGLGLGWMRITVPAKDSDPAVSAHNIGLHAGALVITTFSVSRHWALTAALGASVGGLFTAAPSDANFIDRLGANNQAIAQPPLTAFRTAVGLQYAR